MTKLKQFIVISLFNFAALFLLLADFCCKFVDSERFFDGGPETIGVKICILFYDVACWFDTKSIELNKKWELDVWEVLENWDNE